MSSLLFLIPVMVPPRLPTLRSSSSRRNPIPVASSSTLSLSSPRSSQSDVSDSKSTSDSDSDYEPTATISTTPIHVPPNSKRTRRQSTTVHPSSKPARKRQRDLTVTTTITPSSPDTALPPTKSAHCATSLTSHQLSVFRNAILDWYTQNHRSFPWRPPPRHRVGHPPSPRRPPAQTDDAPGAPYAIWVSEVMSQQTRIDVVVDYFQRWMQRFPTLRTLSDASQRDVDEVWAGLGYYRRARFLREGAVQIVRDNDGMFPCKAAELRKVRGVGPYTAGAVASIAFEERVAAVDGNVERVVSRLLPAIGRLEEKGRRMGEVWKVADEFVRDVECAGDFNQGLMELGATVCKPRAALCGVCPVSVVCGGFEEGGREVGVGKVDEIGRYVERFPTKVGRKVVKVRDEAVVVLVTLRDVGRMEKGEGLQVALTRREDGGLLGGLWEAVNCVVGTKFEEGAEEDALKGLQGRMGIEAEVMERVVDAGKVRHIFSHIRQTLWVWVVVLEAICEVGGGEGLLEDGTEVRWVDCGKLKGEAVSTQMGKVVARAVRGVTR